MCCCMPSLVEILCCLDEEIGLVCWQLIHDIHAMEIFGIQPTCELSLFSLFVFHSNQLYCIVGEQL